MIARRGRLPLPRSSRSPPESYPVVAAAPARGPRAVVGDNRRRAQRAGGPGRGSRSGGAVAHPAPARGGRSAPRDRRARAAEASVRRQPRRGAGADRTRSRRRRRSRQACRDRARNRRGERHARPGGSARGRAPPTRPRGGSAAGGHELRLARRQPEEVRVEGGDVVEEATEPAYVTGVPLPRRRELDELLPAPGRHLGDGVDAGLEQLPELGRPRHAARQPTADADHGDLAATDSVVPVGRTGPNGRRVATPGRCRGGGCPAGGTDGMMAVSAQASGEGTDRRRLVEQRDVERATERCSSSPSNPTASREDSPSSVSGRSSSTSSGRRPVSSATATRSHSLSCAGASGRPFIACGRSHAAKPLAGRRRRECRRRRQLCRSRGLRRRCACEPRSCVWNPTHLPRRSRSLGQSLCAQCPRCRVTSPGRLWTRNVPLCRAFYCSAVPPASDRPETGHPSRLDASIRCGCTRAATSRRPRAGGEIASPTARPERRSAPAMIVTLTAFRGPARSRKVITRTGPGLRRDRRPQLTNATRGATVTAGAGRAQAPSADSSIGQDWSNAVDHHGHAWQPPP